jgi:hypothetical protein
MIKRILGLLLPTIMLGALQATALPVTQWVSPIPSYLRATCSAVTTDLTTYSWTVTTGATDSDRVLVVVGVTGEDAAGNFTISSATIEGAAANTGVQMPTSTVAFMQAGFIQSATAITGAASVDITVTYSEAIQAATACVWVIYNLDNVTPWQSRTYEFTASEASNNTLTFMPAYAPVSFGICANNGILQTVTWSGLTEREDTNGAEFSYSAADATLAAATSAGSGANGVSASCNSDQNSFVVAVVAYGNSFPSEVRVTGPDCKNSAADQTTYTSTVFLPVNDADTVLLVAAVAGEDAAATFGVSSMDFDGTAGTEIVDEDGTGIVNTAIYVASVTGAAVIPIGTTWSEAITGHAICVWAITGLTSATAVATVADDDTAAGALVLTLTGTKGGVTFGICAASALADTPVWGILIGEWDTNASDAELDAAPAIGFASGDSQAITCDYDNGNDTSGVAASFR